jgi:hypothetical protein
MNRTSFVLASLVAATLLFCRPGPLRAQHSDVEFSYQGGKIDVEFGAEGQVFEGEFPTSGMDLQFTSEPGFSSEIAEGLGINPNDEIVYNVLSGLLFWDGSTISPAAAAATQIRIDNRPPSVPDTIVTGSSAVQLGAFSPTPANRIGAADGVGDFHSDLDWFLESSSGSPATGAYAVKLSLSTDESGITDSDPFFIVQNLGLSETDFEAGVEAFAAVVPEPGTFSLVGMIGLLFAARRFGHR